MKNHNRTTYMFALALLVAGTVMISPAIKAADAPVGSSEEVSQLLAELKTEAKALERDANELAIWARSKQLSGQSHAAKLNAIRDHVNQAGKLLGKLNEVRGTASPWQQQAIDRIYPLLKELADNVTATINHLKDNQSRFHYSPYTDYAKAGDELARELAALISDYVKYGELEAEFHRLQDKLEQGGS